MSRIKALHVYDFDNTRELLQACLLSISRLILTVFLSPLPNKQLWHGSTIGFLGQEDCLVNGGWWHDKNILEATGQGIEKEEPRAWEGWWNEEIVQTRMYAYGHELMRS